jgi:hypothetical protein
MESQCLFAAQKREKDQENIPGAALRAQLAWKTRYPAVSCAVNHRRKRVQMMPVTRLAQPHTKGFQKVSIVYDVTPQMALQIERNTVIPRSLHEVSESPISLRITKPAGWNKICSGTVQTAKSWYHKKI